MDMDQLQNNLEELYIVTKERNKLNIKLKDAQDLIQKLKQHIESSRLKNKESHDQIKDSEEVSKLKKENEILKHKLEITNLKMIVMEGENKSQLDLRSENADLKSKLTKVTSKLETKMLQYT